MNVLSSLSLILILPLRRPSLPSSTLPVPETWSNSQAPSHVNDTPAFVALQFTYASSGVAAGLYRGGTPAPGIPHRRERDARHPLRRRGRRRGVRRHGGSRLGGDRSTAAILLVGVRRRLQQRLYGPGQYDDESSAQHREDAAERQPVTMDCLCGAARRLGC